MDRFTGILDKNGKRIFHNDIVRNQWGHGPEPPFRNHQIIFESGKVGPCVSDNVCEWRLHDCYNLWNGNDVELVGNVYENPELIEASQSSLQGIQANS